MRAALNGLGRGGLLAVMAALVAALVVVAMLVYTPATQAQGTPGRSTATATRRGATTNPYVLVVVQTGGQKEQAHQNHLEGGSQERNPPDIDLGSWATEERLLRGLCGEMRGR